MSDYVADSKLEVTVLRPKKAVVTLSVPDVTSWESLWRLEHPGAANRAIDPKSRIPTTFKLTFVNTPGGRRAVLVDLTVEAALSAALVEVDGAMKDTASDRATLGARTLERSFKQQDNRRFGGDRNGGARD